MGRYTKYLSFFAVAVMIMSLSIVASAQWRDRRGNNDYYGNNTYNRNLDSTIRNLRDKSRRFEDVLDRELDRSRYDGSRREDQLNKLASRFKNAAENLDDEYERGRNMRKSSDEAQKVLSIGSQLDRALASSRANRNSRLRTAWSSIERDLSVISRAYRTGYYNTRGTRTNRNGTYYPNGNRNGRNDRNRRGTYNRRGTQNLRYTIQNLKRNSARFEDRIDREYDDNNRYGRRSSNIEKVSDRFHDAVKDLEDEYDDRRDYNDSYDEVRRVLSLGEQLDREVSRARLSRSLRSEWSRIEQDLRTISRAYNMNYNGRSNRSVRISDIWRNFPF